MNIDLLFQIAGVGILIFAVNQVLQKAGREDLIGYGKHALVPPRAEKRAGETPDRCRKKNANLHEKRRKAAQTPRKGAPKQR